MRRSVAGIHRLADIRKGVGDDGTFRYSLDREARPVRGLPGYDQEVPEAPPTREVTDVWNFRSASSWPLEPVEVSPGGGFLCLQRHIRATNRHVLGVRFVSGLLAVVPLLVPSRDALLPILSVHPRGVWPHAIHVAALVECFDLRSFDLLVDEAVVPLAVSITETI